jgi:hypothetical protein
MEVLTDCSSRNNNNSSSSRRKSSRAHTQTNSNLQQHARTDSAREREREKRWDQVVGL